MSGANLQHLLAMVLYMAAVVGIGIYFAGRANKDAESYFLGGRSLGPWVTAFSAEASDMSGYLLMGLPGLAYWTGLADAGWTCIGLAIGTYLNFLIVSKRLRRYSIAVDAFCFPLQGHKLSSPSRERYYPLPYSFCRLMPGTK